MAAQAQPEKPTMPKDDYSRSRHELLLTAVEFGWKMYSIGYTLEKTLTEAREALEEK